MSVDDVSYLPQFDEEVVGPHSGAEFVQLLVCPSIDQAEHRECSLYEWGETHGFDGSKTKYNRHKRCNCRSRR